MAAIKEHRDDSLKNGSMDKDEDKVAENGPDQPAANTIPRSAVTPQQPTFVIGQVVPSQVFANISSDQIVITEDKVRLHIKDFIEVYVGRDTIIALISLLATLLGTCLASTFGDVWFIKGEQIKTVFILAAVVSLVYLGIIINKKYRKTMTIDQFIEKMKGKGT